MKTFTITVLAAGLLAIAGGARADAECQAGSAYGAKPGCGHADSVPYIVNNNSGGPAIGWNGYGWGGAGAVLGALGAAQIYGGHPVYGNNSVYVDPHTGIAYAYPHYQTQRNRRDRDGDGIANRNDRYPDDPRYR